MDYKKAASEATQRIVQRETEQLKREQAEDKFSAMVWRVARECAERFKQAIAEETGCIGFNPYASFRVHCCLQYELAMPWGYSTKAYGAKATYGRGNQSVFTYIAIPERSECRCDYRINYHSNPSKLHHFSVEQYDEQELREAFEKWTFANWVEYWVKAARTDDVKAFYRPQTSKEREESEAWSANCRSAHLEMKANYKRFVTAERNRTDNPLSRLTEDPWPLHLPPLGRVR